MKNENLERTAREIVREINNLHCKIEEDTKDDRAAIKELEKLLVDIDKKKMK